MHWHDKVKAQKASGVVDSMATFAAHAVAKGMGFKVNEIDKALKQAGVYNYEDFESVKVDKLYKIWWQIKPRPFRMRDLYILPEGTQEGVQALEVVDQGLYTSKVPDQGPLVVGRIRGTDKVLLWAYVDITLLYRVLIPPYLTLERATDPRFVLIKQDAAKFFAQLVNYDT